MRLDALGVFLVSSATTTGHGATVEAAAVSGRALLTVVSTWQLTVDTVLYSSVMFRYPTQSYPFEDLLLKSLVSALRSSCRKFRLYFLKIVDRLK